MAVVSVAEPVEAAFFCSKISSTSNSIFSIIGLFCGVVGGIGKSFLKVRQHSSLFYSQFLTSLSLSKTFA